MSFNAVNVYYILLKKLMFQASQIMDIGKVTLKTNCAFHYPSAYY